MLRALLDGIEGSSALFDPVDEDLAPDYSEVIGTPMCFRDVTERAYPDEASMRRDTQKVLDNCFAYNAPWSRIGRVAQEIEKACTTKWSCWPKRALPPDPFKKKTKSSDPPPLPPRASSRLQMWLERPETIPKDKLRGIADIVARAGILPKHDELEFFVRDLPPDVAWMLYRHLLDESDDDDSDV